MKKPIQDCVIIGSGPAGYTAAIYAARANLRPIVLQGIQPGGQLTITTEVENFPSYPEFIMGPELMERFEKQAHNLGVEIIFSTVTAVDFNNHPYTLTLDSAQTLQTKALIIATGASAKWLGVTGEERLNGKGVSACAVCDGFFFKNKEVAIVGGGDTACEEALYLSKICTKVHMIIRGSQMRASKIMQDKVMQSANIQCYFNTQTREILGETKVEQVLLYSTDKNEEFFIKVDGFFVAIGHTPNSGIFTPAIKTDEIGYIITEPGTSKTNIPGVFAAGDVQDKTYRQAITAAGSGCIAALDLERFLQYGT